jgi:hypothetical protein
MISGWKSIQCKIPLIFTLGLGVSLTKLKFVDKKMYDIDKFGAFDEKTNLLNVSFTYFFYTV